MTIKYYLKKIAKFIYCKGVRPWVKYFPQSLKIHLLNDLAPAEEEKPANPPVFTLPIANLSYVDQLRLAQIKELHINKQQKSYTDFLMAQGLGLQAPAVSSSVFSEELPAIAFTLRHLNAGLTKTLLAGGPLRSLPHYLAYSTQQQIDILNDQVFSYDHPQINVLPAISLHQAISQKKYHTVIYNFSTNTPLPHFHNTTQLLNELLPAQTVCLFTAAFTGNFYLAQIMPHFQALLQFFTSRFKSIEFSTSTFDALACHWQFGPLHLQTSLSHPNDQLMLLFAGQIT